jgi:hypothetical protein
VPTETPTTPLPPSPTETPTTPAPRWQPRLQTPDSRP